MIADEMHDMAVHALKIRAHLQRRVREDMARIARLEAGILEIDAKMKIAREESQPSAPAPLSP